MKSTAFLSIAALWKRFTKEFLVLVTPICVHKSSKFASRHFLFVQAKGRSGNVQMLLLK